jgi:galactonate dehydratase
MLHKLRITDLEVILMKAGYRGNWIFIRLHTSSGLIGLGEASQSGNDSLVIKATKKLVEQIKGENPLQVEVLWKKMVKESRILDSYAGRVGATAISAIDQCLWDIRGKFFNLPIWRIMGGYHHKKVQLYANINRGLTDRSTNGFAEKAKKALKTGFKAIKCAPFDEVHYQNYRKKDLELGIERIKQIRSYIGAKIKLLVDCHSRFNLPLALEIIEKLQDYNIYWLEEPVSRVDIDAMRDLSKKSVINIAGGESYFGLLRFWDSIIRGTIHIIMPDVKHAGGLTECKRIATIACIKNIPVAPHNPSGPISTMASVHFATSIPNFLILEYAFDEVEWRERITQPNETVEEGFIQLTDKPGLGIKLKNWVTSEYRIHL